jgi:hypothetical protein
VERSAVVERSTVWSRTQWQGVVIPFLVSRLVSDVLIGAMAWARGADAVRGGFGIWDGRWYTWVAAHGYSAIPPHALHHQTPWPFFPLLPLAMKSVSRLGGVSLPVAGIVVNHVVFFVALVGIHRIALRHVSHEAASLAVWIAALGPLAFVFSMIYPSALFMAASVWAFLLVERGNDALAGIAVAGAALARPDGVVVALVLLFVVRFEWSRVTRVCGPAAVALSAWMFFNYERTGDALRFLHAKLAWHEVDLVALIHRPRAPALVHLMIAVIAFLLVVMARRAIPRAWSWFTGLYLLPSLVFGIVGLGRYATETFPPFVATGALLAPRSRRTSLLTCGALLGAQALFAYFYIARNALL